MDVDKKVWDLAKLFLADEMPAPNDEIVDALAGHLQRELEDWIEYEKRPDGLLS